MSSRSVLIYVLLLSVKNKIIIRVPFRTGMYALNIYYETFIVQLYLSLYVRTTLDCHRTN